MSSYATTARPPTNTNCDLETTYAMDTFFPTFTQSQPQRPQQPHQDLCNNEKINMAQSEFDCFPQTVASIPLENLSLNQHMSNDWPLELGGEYQSDINFLFSCNELGVTASESSSSSAAITTAAAVEYFQTQQQSIKETEQFRRFSLEETDTLGNLMPFYPNPVYNNNNNKERASMPDVFAHIPSTNTTMPQQSQLSWQQNTLLQKRPDYPPQTVISSASSPLKKHAKKRSLVDQVLNEEYMPSVASSLSEPTPTSQQWMIRKRTKSIRHNKTEDHSSAASPTTPTSVTGILNAPEYIVSSSAPTDSDIMQQQQHHQHHQHQDYMVPSDPILNYEDINTSATSSANDNNQLLAAMPRRQKLRYDGDNYTPKWVRFTGHLKEGYCDSCQPGKWLQLKNSAYWYHKQFYHGISSVSGKSFMKPLEQRMGKGDMIEGLCHQCHRFVSACNGKKKNNYMLWYRHAHKCHLYDKPKATLKNVRKLSNDTITPTTSTDATATTTTATTTTATTTTTKAMGTTVSSSPSSSSSTLHHHQQQQQYHLN